MAYAHQKRVGAEIRARIPRGITGSTQNIFRQYVTVYRLMNLPFDVSRDKALAMVRVQEPGFVPVVLPPFDN
jgi:hypothetical protein